MSIRWKKWAPLAIGAVLLVTPVPSGLTPAAWHYFALFVAVICGLVLESMPVGAVGLIGLTVAALSGWVEKDPNKALR